MKLFYSQVRSKNYSCNDLRRKNNGIGPFPIRSIVRLGSTTETEIAFKKNYGKRPIVEVNTVEAIQNSRSKLKMKECFTKFDIPQSKWWNSFQALAYDKKPSYPILAKRIYGFKGYGMAKLDSQQQLEEWLSKHPNTEGWYFEEFKNYSREYRLHCTSTDCFMTWRKLRRRDAPTRWYFNSSNCNWVSEEHELFDRPNNWENIIRDSCKAIEAVGLDLGAVDVRVQSNTNKHGEVRSEPEYIILEVNSAPALGEQGIEIYKSKLTEIIDNKLKNL